jgi:predicted secreted hydrolase
MRSKLACLVGFVLMVPASASQYRVALPGYRYEFPHDHFSHPDFQTEWWYYTGNVQAQGGHRFGFELAFFRQGVDRDAGKTSTWDVHDLFLAHLALSDLDGQAFYHTERLNRAGPGLAGASEPNKRIWNGNWEMEWQGDEQELRAVADQFELNFTLRADKPPVIHGEGGVSQKAKGAGRASHYTSLTRLITNGRIKLAGKSFEVAGLSWMDHEFFSRQLAANQVGWDWMSLQLDDRTELMLFRIRRQDGSSDPYSAGTFIDVQGGTGHLHADEFTLQPLGDSWTSPVTNAAYPIRWKVEVPKLGIELEVRTPLASQELAGDSNVAPNYWEGAIRLAGRKNNAPLKGIGYLEMTGYDRPVRFGR